MNIIGISAYNHDSAAALIINGEIAAAAQEERFTRKKHDSSFPTHALKFCLSEANLKIQDIDAIVFYSKPQLTFKRLLDTYLNCAPQGLSSFLKSAPNWISEKMFFRKHIESSILQACGATPKDILFSEHHESHAASSFFPSAFDKAAVLCVDGEGEWATTSAWFGNGNQLDPLWELKYPHSISLLYSAFTSFTGFKVNSGEYKVMGLAPYGKPKYTETIYKHLIDLKDDGTFQLNMSYFDCFIGPGKSKPKFAGLFGGPPRKTDGRITQREMDLAKSIQDVTEEIVLRLARSLHKDTVQDQLCMAGEIALNCIANGRLLREGPFKNIYIQPASGDAGGAIGCALSVYHKYFEKPRNTKTVQMDGMKGSFLGPKYSNEEIEHFLLNGNIAFTKYTDVDLFEKVSDLLANEKIIGWFQGRMEFGPKALGCRSIIGDARSNQMQSALNLKIKYRESFRPFAPSILSEKVSEYFDLEESSPYMLFTAPVTKKHQIKIGKSDSRLWGIDLLNIPKSDIPSVTHVDYSSRIHTVHQETNPRYYDLIKAFERKTGCPVIVNTSFNVRGEPIVNTPSEAYRCFMRTEMDVLVLENYIILKSDQPDLPRMDLWKKQIRKQD